MQWLEQPHLQSSRGQGHLALHLKSILQLQNTHLLHTRTHFSSSSFFPLNQDFRRGISQLCGYPGEWYCATSATADVLGDHFGVIYHHSIFGTQGSVQRAILLPKIQFHLIGQPVGEVPEVWVTLHTQCEALNYQHYTYNMRLYTSYH